MRNIRLLVEYDGTDFVGWQWQTEGRTVQVEIEAVLSRVLQEKVSLVAAGRTDAGVHARGQVANFHTNSTLDTPALLRALNALLPADVTIHDVTDVPDSFHSRYDARARNYRYYLSRRQSAMTRAYKWYVGYPLDPMTMKLGAGIIMGEHDFTSFSKVGSDVHHYRCNVERSFWKEEGDLLVYEICADRFVRGMVRALVGTMIDLGRGFISIEEFRMILESRDRSRAGTLAPPRGLVLESVMY